jgi:hypothetical protein
MVGAAGARMAMADLLSAVLVLLQLQQLHALHVYNLSGAAVPRQMVVAPDRNGVNTLS